MSVIATIWHVLELYVTFCWPVVLCLQIFVRPSTTRVGRRLQRGKYWRWCVRRFGLMGDWPIYAVGVLMWLVYLFTTDGKS